jgi:hypothetical protein
MRVEFAACCETVLQDVRTSNLSLINLIDELRAVAFPVIVQKLCFVAVIDRTLDEPSTSQGRLVGTLNGNVAFSFETPIDFQGRTRTRAVGEFQGILMQAPGTLVLGLTLEGQELAAVTVEVRHIGNPQAELFGGPGTLQSQ